MAANAQKNHWYTVDKQLLPVKGIYFTFLAAVGDLLPFIPIYMKELGLSSTEAGIIYGVMPFASFFMRPLFGAAADKLQRHKLILMTCLLLTGTCYCLLLVVPAKTEMETKWTTSLRTNIQCNQMDSFIKDCELASHSNNSKTPELQSCSRSLSKFSKQFTDNTTGVECTASCVADFMPLNTRVCFTNDVSVVTQDTCLYWNSTSQPQGLQFTITDLSAVSKNKVIGENTTYDGKTCQNYDLKNVTYENKKFWQFVCSDEAVFDCELKCDEKYHVPCVSVTKLSKTFWIFFIIFLFCNIFFTPVLSLVDAMVYDILGHKGGNWGKQRLWGTVGFAIFAIASTFIMDEISKSNKSIDYTPSFIIFLVLTVLSTIVTYFLDFSETLQCKQMFKNITMLLKYPEIVVFMFIMTCIGMMNAVTEAFLFWYLQDLGSTQIILGLCLLCNCIPEILMLCFAGKIIKKIGHVQCLYLALFAYAVRFTCYSFLTNAWYVIPIELTHGLCFALMYAAASLYASKITPEGMSATMQGLIGGLYFNFGKGIGSLVTGKLFDPVSGLGAVWTFRVYGIAALVLLILYVIVQNLFFRKSLMSAEQSPKKKQEADGDTTAAGDLLLGANTVSNENSQL